MLREERRRAEQIRVEQAFGRGQMGSARIGSLHFFLVFVDRGTFWVLLLACFYLPKSARAYYFPQSLSKPITFLQRAIRVDPICPQPKVARERAEEAAAAAPSKAAKQAVAATKTRPQREQPVFREGGWYGWKPSSRSSSNFSIRAFRACPLVEIRQTAPCRAIRGNSISVNSTLPSSFVLELILELSRLREVLASNVRPYRAASRYLLGCARLSRIALMRGWRNTVGNLFDIFWSKKAYHRSPASFHWYMQEKQRGTVSSNSRFQTVRFRQYSANLSSQLCRARGPASSGRRRTS